jgi:uncharacterized membrane protein YkgB
VTNVPIDLDRIDRAIAGFMRRIGEPALRISLAVVFIWFGLLKPLGFSPAADLVRQTVTWMPFLTPDGWLHAIGWWEVVIGVTFLFRRTIRIAIALMAMQMVGTFLPLVMLPEVTFQPGRAPWALTIEGQYIIKNILIISAALVVGGTVRRGVAVDDRPAARHEDGGGAP